MQSYLVDRKNKEDVAAVEQAYWDLADPSLLCAPGFAAPSMGEIKSGRFVPILCKDGDKVIGVMCIKKKDNGVYYPSMLGTKDEQREILKSMCALAQEKFDSLTATTSNAYIHELAREGGLPYDLVDGVIVWHK